MARAAFPLTKWYADVVTADGRLRIGYAARLAIGGLPVRYAAVLSAGGGVAPSTRVRLRGANLPRLEEDGRTLHWHVPGLELEGEWQADAAPVERELLPEPGALTWRCVMPRARVSVTHGGERLAGLGYAEVVELRVPPWRLPIESLRWGRAHVGGRTAVWIDWGGAGGHRWAFLDGREVPGAQVDDDRVRLGGLDFGLERVATLREGRVAQTALAKTPALGRLLSRNKLLMDETKWLSRARLDGEAGWAIHEVVRWR